MMEIWFFLKISLAGVPFNGWKACYMLIVDGIPKPHECDQASRLTQLLSCYACLPHLLKFIHKAFYFPLA